MTYQQYPILAPWQGHIDNVPTPHNPANSFDDIVNFLCRKGRVHSRFKLNPYGVTAAGDIVRNAKTYFDAQNNFHTLILTTKNAYALTTGPTYNLLTPPAGFADLSGTALPYGISVSQGRVYFSNGSTPVFYTDGEATLKDSNSPGAARFLTLNSSHLIIAYTTEPEPGAVGSTVFPQRVRWAKSGDPNTWTGFGTGFEDLLDVPDEITGLATVGRNTLIFRTNGFSLMTGTGNGAIPFTIEHISTDDIGSGNVFPYSIALFGTQAVYISQYDINMVSSGLAIQPIAGKAKKKIMQQLGDTSGDQVVGFAVGSLAPGVDYRSYWLVIPGQSTWVYNFDEDNWQEFDAPEFGRPTFVGTVLVP